MPRQRKIGNVACSCNGTYAKSLQGICKLIALILSLLAIIIIGASPYWRALFVLEAITWPFHIVMLITSLVFISTLIMYSLFLSGQHLEYPQVAWPTLELIFNLVCFVAMLIAASLEAANVWRWDMSRGYYQRDPSSSGGLLAYGYGSGMSLTNQINLSGYCQRYPRDCQDYFSLLTGNNSYFGNHVFATILLFLLMILYIVSSYFAWRTWRVFKSEMSNGLEDDKPSAWGRFRSRIAETRLNRVNVKDRLTSLLSRNRRDDETDEVQSVEMNDDVAIWKAKESDKHSHHASSLHSSTHKSHHSSHHRHHDSSSRSSSSKRHHDHPSEKFYHESSRSHLGSEKSHRYGSEKSRHSEGRSRHHDNHEKAHHGRKSTGSSSRSSRHKDRKGSQDGVHGQEVADLDAKAIGSAPGEDGPVASVMC